MGLVRCIGEHALDGRDSVAEARIGRRSSDHGAAPLIRRPPRHTVRRVRAGFAAGTLWCRAAPIAQGREQRPPEP